MTKKLVVGLTGGIGSGKTTVSDQLASYGIDVIDADVCARIVVEPGKPALEKINAHFGDQILDPSGHLDRAKLREIIFSAPEEKQWLEQLLHPLIIEEIQRQLDASSSVYAVFVSPLLIEAGQSMFCNHILVVDAPEEEQLNRTMERDNNNREQVAAIMNTQASRNDRLEKADDIILNNGDLEHLYQQVESVHHKLLELAGA
jgi:dephospho-CoA kinase